MAEVSLQTSPVQYDAQNVVLPSVEVSRKWGDGDSTSSSSSSGLGGKSRIPRPVQVPQRSTDAVLLVQEVGRGTSPRNSLGVENSPSTVPQSSVGHGLEHPQTQESERTQVLQLKGDTSARKERSKTSEMDTRPSLDLGNMPREETSDLLRKPRYQGTFTSYEEMLNHMETTDPFNGPPPPQETDRLATRRKPPTQRSEKSNSSRTPRNLGRSKSEDKSHIVQRNSHKSKRRKENTSIAPSGSGNVDLNSTYTLGQDNSISPQQEMSNGVSLGRRNSVASVGTYVIDLDSKTKLMQESVPANMVKTGKEKVIVDSRATYKIQGDINEYSVRAIVRDLGLQCRLCCRYIKDKDEKDGRCGCGRLKEWHVSNNVPVGPSSTSEVWNSEKHTKTFPTDTFGTINFQGFGPECTRCAPYIRVDHKVDLEKLRLLLTDSQGWNLPAPKLIISVTGGAKRLLMKARLRTIIKRGIVNAAASTGAWIITGGTNTGVMALVGEAVRDHMLMTGSTEQKIVALGMVTWGVIDNKDILVSGGDGLFPAEYSRADLVDQSIKALRLAWLDSNHTHFIMVDSGTHQRYGQEIEVWTALVQHISKKMETSIGRNQSVHVPAVVLVLDGGENTLQTVAESIKQDTPVVVVQGSGRAADYIAFAYRNTRSKDGNEEETREPPKFEAELKQKAETLFSLGKISDASKKAKSITNCVKKVRKCLEKRHLLTVFNPSDVDTASEIDQAILFALLKAKKSNAESQLNLSLAWNRPDIVKEHIFSLENRKRWQNLNLEKPMFTALVQDKADFVQLFLDDGIKPQKFLTCARLHRLYADVIGDHLAGSMVDLLRHKLQEIQASRVRCILCCSDISWEDNHPDLLLYVGHVIKDLMGDQQLNMYRDMKVIIQGDEKTADSVDGIGAENEVTLAAPPRHEAMGTQISQEKIIFPHAERELFLWAILLNRRELALLFWKCGKDHIGAALTASALLKSLSDEANQEEEVDLAQDLLAHASDWEERAIGVLNECYQHNKAKAHWLLIREVESLGNITLFTTADTANQMDFMGHPCCQTKLNRIWKGRMALYTPTWKILLSMFLPFCLPMIKYTTISSAKDTGATQSESRNNTNGQNPGQGGGDGGGNRSNPRMRIGLYQVGQKNCHRNKTINILQAAISYYTAPVTKFFFHTLSYIVFLILFSYFVLTDLHPVAWPTSPSPLEYVIWVWAFTFILEEIRQIHAQRAKSLYYKLRSYFASAWNRFDQTVHMMLVVSIILRLTLPEGEFVWARMLYCLTLALSFLRFMQAFYVAINIGPKVIMISRMLTDLMFFLCILAVVLLGFGVAIQALRFPNSKPEWSLLKDIVYKPYWQMYGELFLEELEGDVGDCSNNATVLAQHRDMKPCPQKSWLAILLLAVYMVMTNILLLNLLIAMFSYTFERVQENSEKVWRFYRYSLFHEYFERPTLAPPLIIFSHIFMFMKYVRRVCCGRNASAMNDFRVPCEAMKPGENRQLTAFEREGMETYLLRQNTLRRELIDVKVTSAGDRIEKVIEDLETLKEQVTSQGEGGRITEAPLISHVEAPLTTRSSGHLSDLKSQVASLSMAVSDQASELHRVGNLLKSLLAQQGSQGASGRTAFTNPQIEIQDVASGNEF